MLKFTAPQKLFSEVVPIHSVDWVVDSMNVHFLTIEKPQKVNFHIMTEWKWKLLATLSAYFTFIIARRVQNFFTLNYLDIHFTFYLRKNFCLRGFQLWN